MSQLSVMVYSLILIRLFFLCLYIFSSGVVSFGLKKARISSQGWRWRGFGWGFGFISLGAYLLMISPTQSWSNFLDTSRPVQPRVVSSSSSGAIVFWETSRPTSGWVRYGYRPEELVYVAKSSSVQEPSSRHSVIIDAPVPKAGLYAVIYSDGQIYLDHNGRPFFFANLD